MTHESRPLGVSARSRLFLQERGFSLVLAVMFLGIFILRQPGADFSHYADWARAFRHADILALDLDGTWSPVSVPLSQWQFGTGLFLALPSFFGPADLLAFPALISCAGLLFFFLALRSVTRDRFIAILFFCLGWLATPYGYYTFSQSSESLAAAFLSIYFYLITSDSRRTPGFFFLCGIAGGFAISTRTQLAVWVAAGIPLLLAKMSGWRLNDRTTRPRALASLVLFAAPLVAAVIASQVVNRWMTGSAFLSPYVFGDSRFQSVDLLHPQLLAVLFHPWHGLLAYHPFYLVPILLLGASMLALLRGRFSEETTLAPAVFVAFCLQLWLQSAWYCWWLGTDTFGLRALAPAAVPILIATAPLYEKLVAAGAGRGFRAARITTGFLLLATAWSALLLTQGPTNFTTLTSLVAGQAIGLWTLLATPATYVAASVGIGLVWLISGNPAPVPDSPSRTPALLLMAAVLSVLLRNVLGQQGTVSLAALLLSALVLALALKPFDSRSQGSFRQRLVLAGGLVLAGTWIFSQVVFVRLAMQVESQLRPNPDGQTFYVQEVVDTYREYLGVSGFEDEKLALEAFLSSSISSHQKSSPAGSP